MSFPILAAVTFVPLAGAVLLIFIPRNLLREIRIFALAVSLVTFGLSVWLFFKFDGASAFAQFEERRAWLGFGMDYHCSSSS
jgi:NADH-quinone oxidoreductase subunit M